MIRHDCEICRGSQIIRLPVYRRTVMEIEPTAEISEPYRIFPCPECGDQIPTDRMAIVESHVMVDSRINDERFTASAKRQAGFSLLDSIMANGSIRYERGPEARDQYPMRATIGVVTPGMVATFEERVHQRQEEIAHRVVKEAIAAINNWGSYYGTMIIHKTQADDELRRALKSAISK